MLLFSFFFFSHIEAVNLRLYRKVEQLCFGLYAAIPRFYSYIINGGLHIYTFLMNRDAAVYALGVGACGRDAIDAEELKFVYHEKRQQSIQV